MKAVVIREHGGPEVLNIETLPRPTPKPGEVLVQVKAVALNHLDIWVRRGLPGAPFRLPAITGADASGIIAAHGEGVDAPPVGTPVLVLPGVSCGHCRACLSGFDNRCPQYAILGEGRDGAFAEYITLPQENVIPKPDAISFEEGAAMSLTFLTAWHMLTTRAQVGPGDRLLVQAGGSGVGVAAIQIGQFLGAEVLATAGSPEKRKKAIELGALMAFDSRDPAWPSELKKHYPKGVDVVFEHVGGETFERSLRVLSPAGRLVTCGATTGHKVQVDLRHLFFKSQSILGSTMGTKAEYHQLVRLYAQGRFRPVIDQVLPLEDVAKAHQRLENREAFGKIVLIP